MVGVTDTMEVAKAMNITDTPVSADDFLCRIGELIQEISAQGSGRPNFVARVLVMEAVVRCLLPEVQLVFRSDIEVNWAVGYLFQPGV